MVAERLGPSGSMRVVYRFGPSVARLAMAGLPIVLVLAAVSCHGEPQRDPSAGSRLFPASLDHFLLVASDRSTDVRFSWTGRPTGASGRPSIPAFGPSRRLVQRARLATEVERDLDRLPDLERLHGLGIYHAVDGQLDLALDELEAAALEMPDEIDIWIDLSAVRLLRYRESNRIEDLVGAFRSSQRAVALDPLNVSAVFNRAQSLDAFFLKDQATLEWRRFVDLDPSREWAEVARRRLHALALEGGGDPCGEARLAAGEQWERERKIPTGIVHRMPQCFRMWVAEEILPEWARARRSEDGRAGDRLDLARALAGEIASSTGDHLLGDTLQRLGDLVGSRDRSSADRVADSLERLGTGLVAYRTRELNRARRDLSRAKGELLEARLPIWGVAAFYLAVLDHYADPAEAVRSLGNLLSDLPIDRYPHLRGFSELMLGTIEAGSGDSESGVRFYGSARPFLERAAGDVVGFLLYPSLGDGLRLLGRDDEAWKAYLQGLEAASRSGSPQRYGVALYTVVELLKDRGDHDVALVFGDELVANAGGAESFELSAEAHLQRGSARHALGMEGDAADDLARARAWADRIESEETRDRIGSAVDLAIAAAEIENRPAEALRRLDRLLADRSDHGYLYRMPSVLMLRGRAHGLLGDRTRQGSDLLGALRLSERLRAEAEQPGHRRSLFAQAREIYEATVRFRIDSDLSGVMAFEISEHGRAREIGEAVGLRGARAFQDGFRPLGLAEIQAELPPGLVIVEYFTLSDRLLTWVVSGDGFVQLVETVERQDVEVRVERLRRALDRRAPPPTVRARSAELHDLLIAEVLNHVPPAAGLVFVPDRFLSEVPFAALYDAEAGRYLVEDHPVAVHPSATTYALALDGSGQAGASSTGVLAVGDPAFERSLHPELERLPTAEREAVEVRKLFDRGEVLTGTSATEEAVVAALARHPVIFFAAHAVVDPAVPERSGLVLAAGDESDGLLTAEEIGELDLSHVRLVVLAVCDPIQGGDQGDEGLTGIVAALLKSGVGGVVAPTLTVGDASTGWLVDFLRGVASGSDSPEAFRSSQAEALDRLHGRDWAAFRWVGVL